MNEIIFYTNNKGNIIKIVYKEDYTSNKKTSIYLDNENANEYFDLFCENNVECDEIDNGNIVEYHFYDIDEYTIDEMMSIKESNSTPKIITIPSYVNQNEYVEIPKKKKINKTKFIKPVAFVSAFIITVASITSTINSKKEDTKETNINSKFKMSQEINTKNNNVITIDNTKYEIEKENVSNENTVDNLISYNNATIEEDKSIEEKIYEVIENSTPVIEEDKIEDKTNYDVLSLNADDWTTNSKYEISKAYYYDTIVKTANTYGIDPKLALAICTHERGMHNNTVDDGGAIGLFQIQVRGDFAWSQVTAFNFDKSEYETVKITEESVSDVFENIKVGCMIIQNSFKENNYDIPKSIQAYNYGYGNMQKVLNTCKYNENLTDEDMSNQFNLSWLKYRNIVSGGDPEYLENVFKYIEDGSVLEFKKPNGEIVRFVYDNLNNDNYKSL